MKLKNKIDIQIKESMLNKNKSRLIALRAIKSAILLSEKSGEKAPKLLQNFFELLEGEGG